ncbi:MAG: hypothetical protein V5A56_01140 [Halolamina sp.]
MDESYFRGQERAIDAINSTSSLEKRQQLASKSRHRLQQTQVDLDSFTRETLQSESASFREALQRLPEVQYLEQRFPGSCFIVPEWQRKAEGITYGARIYFFRENDAPAPTDVLDRNIDAVVTDDQAAFARYQGALHGYPECCIEYYAEHERQTDTGPEVEAMEPIAPYVDDELGSEEMDRSASIEQLMAGLFETPQAYAFFAREFFPRPGCEQARRRGISIYETLCEAYPEELVKDYFRINAGWSYLMAKATTPDGRSATRPSPGSLGWEHLLFYLPLSVTVTNPRYQTA